MRVMGGEEAIWMGVGRSGRDQVVASAVRRGVDQVAGRLVVLGASGLDGNLAVARCIGSEPLQIGAWLLQELHGRGHPVQKHQCIARLDDAR